MNSVGNIVKIILEAYSIEQIKRNVILEILLRVKNEELWNILFQLHLGNIIHKDMLLEIIEKLGYRYEHEQIESLNFTEKSKEELLRTIFDWEYFSLNYYKTLLEIIDFDVLRKARVDADTLRRILEKLLKLEERQIKLLQKVV